MREKALSGKVMCITFCHSGVWTFNQETVDV